jgi:WD40 repeat protein
VGRGERQGASGPAGHEDRVWAAGFSADGARIVSGSWDHTVRVWDAVSGEELLVLRSHEGPVYAAGFSSNGARIVSASFDKTVRVTWIGRDKKELIGTAHARLPRELTEDEKRRFYLTAQ